MAFEKKDDDLGALWAKTGAKGPYLTGEVGGVKVICFPVTSDNPKAPTWRVKKQTPREEVKPFAMDVDAQDIGF